MHEIERITPTDVQLREIARKKAACPFIGPAVRNGDLDVFGSTERPLAAVQEIADLGDSGGGDLGRRVLRLFATGNHRRVPDPVGRFEEPAPDGMIKSRSRRLAGRSPNRSTPPPPWGG